MRITARLDDESKAHIEQIRHKMGLSTITDVLKYALRDAAESLNETVPPGERMNAFLESPYVGGTMVEDARDLSATYKQHIADHLDDKYGHTQRKS